MLKRDFIGHFSFPLSLHLKQLLNSLSKPGCGEAATPAMPGTNLSLLRPQEDLSEVPWGNLSPSQAMTASLGITLGKNPPALGGTHHTHEEQLMELFG